MEQKTTSFKLIKKIKDEKFNIDHLEHYVLLLQIGTRDLQVCVVDSRDSQCLVLEDYVFAKVNSPEQWKEFIYQSFESHPFLMAGFWKHVKISFKNQKFSHIPNPLFVQDRLYDYLKINCKVSPEKENFYYFKAIKSDAITVFAVYSVVADWLKDLYPNCDVGFVHQSAGLIEGVLDYSSSHKQNSVYLYIDRFKVHILTVKNNNLEYYNQFVVKEFQDYIKYLMMVMKGLNYKQENTHVVLWGYVGKKSPHFNEFHKYIKDISFGDRPSFLKFGYLFDEVQDHQYMDLYSIYLCE